MRENYIILLFSANGLPDGEALAAEEIRKRAKLALSPGCGKYYRSYALSASPWGIDVSHPEGVVLGRSDPEKFLKLYNRARSVQTEAINFHMFKLVESELLRSERIDGNTLLCFVTPRCDEPPVHAIWYMAMLEGELLPDCGIYFADLKKSLISKEEDIEVLSHISNYALCTASLELGGAV